MQEAKIYSWDEKQLLHFLGVDRVSEVKDGEADGFEVIARGVTGIGKTRLEALRNAAQRYIDLGFQEHERKKFSDKL